MTHGLLAGTDIGTVWTTALYLGSASLVGGLAAARLGRDGGPAREPPAPDAASGRAADPPPAPAPSGLPPLPPLGPRPAPPRSSLPPLTPPSTPVSDP
jgi:hypothetical protein